jgi:hypothetical protein
MSGRVMADGKKGKQSMEHSPSIVMQRHFKSLQCNDISKATDDGFLQDTFPMNGQGHDLSKISVMAPSRTGSNDLRVQANLAENDSVENKKQNNIKLKIFREMGNSQSLDSQVIAQMEHHSKSDFSNVQIHTDAQTDRMSRKLNANAFTTGQDIFFRHEEYNPNSPGGGRLLAHELAHVMQQKEGSEKGQTYLNRELLIQRDDAGASNPPQPKSGDTFDDAVNAVHKSDFVEAFRILNGRWMGELLEWLATFSDKYPSEFELLKIHHGVLSYEPDRKRFSAAMQAVILSKLSPIPPVDLYYTYRNINRVPDDQQNEIINYIRKKGAEYTATLLQIKNEPFWQARVKFFSSVKSNLTIRQFNKLEKGLIAVTKNNLSLSTAFFEGYSGARLIVVLPDTAKSWRGNAADLQTSYDPSKIIYAQTNPSTSLTQLLPDILNDDFSDSVLGGLLVHEFLHLSRQPFVFVGSLTSDDPHEGDAYGVEFFFAMKHDNSRRQDDIKNKMDKGINGFTDSEKAAKLFVRSYGTMKVLDEIIEGRSTRTDEPFIKPSRLTPDEARLYSTNYIKSGSSGRLEEITDWVDNHQSLFIPNGWANIKSKLAVP